MQVFKDESAWGSGLSHNHVMRAANWEGEFTYNRDDISVCALDFTVPVNDLRVDEDAMRSFVGYNDTISDEDRATIREHMLGSDQLNGQTHQNITFESISCEQADSETLVVTGEMTLTGVTRIIEFDIDTEVDSDRTYMAGQINFNHSDFNLSPYSAFGGFVKNGEPLSISFDMVGYNN